MLPLNISILTREMIMLLYQLKPLTGPRTPTMQVNQYYTDTQLGPAITNLRGVEIPGGCPETLTWTLSKFSEKKLVPMAEALFGRLGPGEIILPTMRELPNGFLAAVERYDGIALRGVIAKGFPGERQMLRFDLLAGSETLMVKHGTDLSNNVAG